MGAGEYHKSGRFKVSNCSITIIISLGKGSQNVLHVGR